MWLRRLTRRGTSADKSNSLSLLVQQSPVHRLPLLRQLVNVAGRKNGRHDGRVALDSLRDLFIDHLLPPGRALKYFYEQPIDKAEVTKKHLLFFIFEHHLKELYIDYLNTLEVWTSPSNHFLFIFSFPIVPNLFSKQHLIICKHKKSTAWESALIWSCFVRVTNRQNFAQSLWTNWYSFFL